MGCLKIAIADDNENMLRALGQVINGESDMNLVGTATNGKDTYDIIKSKEPDVVLLDIIMPNGDGLAVMQKVQQDKEIKKEPAFIIISAVGKESVTEDAFNMGAVYYFMKPFSNDALGTLDASVRVQLLNLILDLQEHLGISYIYVGQNLGIIKHIADQVLVMDEGEIIESGTPREIFTNPQNNITRLLVESHFGQLLDENAWQTTTS